MANITTQNNIRYSIDSVGDESEFALTVNYYLGAGKVVAPVTFVKWTAEGLPEGLTLSESGLLSGSIHVSDDDVTKENGWFSLGSGGSAN